MKNTALITKILAKKGAPRGNALESLLHFLPSHNERRFVSDFANGLAVKRLDYYVTLWRKIDKLHVADRKAMKRVIGTEIDLQNIVWIYRLKHFFNMFDHRVYGFLIPIRHRLSADMLASMVACKNTNQLQALLAATVYKEVFDSFNKPEQQLAAAVTMRYKAEGKRSHIALLCGYLYRQPLLGGTDDSKNEVY
ncbi:MAG: V-type ATPase subunit [Defluviitaleaceae bacterium]|nr:V-type ATPase subunit [Defluviitaleaceae bacterium]